MMLAHRYTQSGTALRSTTIRIGSMLQQQLNNVLIPSPDGQDQQRVTVSVHQIAIGTLLNKPGHQTVIALLIGRQQRSLTVLPTKTGTFGYQQINDIRSLFEIGAGQRIPSIVIANMDIGTLFYQELNDPPIVVVN